MKSNSFNPINVHRLQVHNRHFHKKPLFLFKQGEHPFGKVTVDVRSPVLEFSDAGMTELKLKSWTQADGWGQSMCHVMAPRNISGACLWQRIQSPLRDSLVRRRCVTHQWRNNSMFWWAVGAKGNDDILFCYLDCQEKVVTLNVLMFCWAASQFDEGQFGFIMVPRAGILEPLWSHTGIFRAPHPQPPSPPEERRGQTERECRKAGTLLGMSQDIFDRVKKVTVEALGVKEEEVNESSAFQEDLGADSLDIVELVMAYEEEFAIDFPDEDGERNQDGG